MQTFLPTSFNFLETIKGPWIFLEILKTNQEAIELCKLTKDNLPKIKNMFMINKEELDIKYIENLITKALEENQNIIKITSYKSFHQLYFLIKHKLDHKIIGWITLKVTGEKTCEFSVTIDKNYKKLGYATEAISLIKIFLKNTKIETLKCEIFRNDLEHIKLVKKSDMRFCSYVNKYPCNRKISKYFFKIKTD